MILQDTYQENPIRGSWRYYAQVKDMSGFIRKVKRIEVFANFEPGTSILLQPLSFLPSASGELVTPEDRALVRPAVWLEDPPVVDDAKAIEVETLDII